jgi:hypothetical protein
MKDYEKLKAFAEELVPGIWRRDSSEGVIRHGHDQLISLYLRGNHTIFGRIENANICEKDMWVVDVDEWIKDTREYWRKMGLPSLQPINQYKDVPEFSQDDIDKIHGGYESFAKAQATFFGAGVHKQIEDTVEKSINQTNKTSIMTNIKNTIKRMALTEPNKTLIKAGLKDINKNWTDDVRENAREDMLQEYLDSKAHVEKMTAVAKEMLENE